ncbi:hypothetical protein LG296_14880 [Ureibacillus chungkukjangi]|uniref:hypothetical protein n=1 Tax=Ureibacillus chungkukjangi TaxID=1202712 RepID=UPI00384BFE3C
MKFIVGMFILGGVAGLLFSYIAGNYSKLTALIILGILVILTASLSFYKKNKVN